MAFLDKHGLMTFLTEMKAWVNSRLSDKVDKTSVEATLKTDSTNPIQNGAVATAIGSLSSTINTMGEKSKVHCGIDVPSDNLGKDGDLYIQLHN